MAGSNSMAGRFRLRIRLLEHGRRDVAFRDLAQRDDRRLVIFPVDHRLSAVGEAARALGREQHELEQVVDVLQAVFYGNAGHGSVEIQGAVERTGSVPKIDLEFAS